MTSSSSPGYAGMNPRNAKPFGLRDHWTNPRRRWFFLIETKLDDLRPNLIRRQFSPENEKNQFFSFSFSGNLVFAFLIRKNSLPKTKKIHYFFRAPEKNWFFSWSRELPEKNRTRTKHTTFMFLEADLMSEIN